MRISNTCAPLGLISCLLASAAAAGDGFEAPPAPAQTAPRPFDGETVTANPPCFVFPATRHFPSYVVQYSRSAEFARTATYTLAGKWMLNAPEHPLEPGLWHWRWRPDTGDDEDTPWSPVRTFTVPETAPVLPFPDIPALVRHIGKSHPRVFVTADHLEKVRRRALELNGTAWQRQVQRYAEHAHGKKLLPEPDFLPDWKHGRLEKYQKTFATYRPFFAEMTRLAREYLLTGNKLSGQEAKRRLMSIVAWDPNGSTSLHHNDEVGTDVVRHCPRAYDWVYPLLSPAERRKCLDIFRVRMQEMYETLTKLPFEKHPYESHRMGYYLPDLLQACLSVSGDMNATEMLHYTMLQLWSPFYPPYGDADGGWNEGPSYWGWIARVCAHTYRLVERATGVPVYERSHLRNQAFYKLYGNPPWFKLSPFGDGQEGPARGGDAMLMLASLYQNPYAKWYAHQLHARLDDFDKLLFPADGIPVRPPLDLPQGRCFFDVGLACSHTNLAEGDNDVAFLLRSCPFGGYGHAYADQNTFVLDAFGEPLIIASGYYQLYGCKHHTQWTWQTKASNSVLVDGKGQPRNWNAKGRIAEFATTVAADYTVGDAHAAYPGVLDRYDRQALFLRPLHTGGQAVIVLHDRIDAKAPSKFQFLLHALDRMQVDEKQQVVRIQHGHSACRVDFLAPAPLEFRQTDQFPVPPPRPAPNQWHLQAGTTTNAKSATSMIVLQPARRADEPGLPRPESTETDAAFGITLNRGARRIAAVFRKDGVRAEFAACGVRTDGQAASITWVDGQPQSAMVAGGTVVGVAGGTVLLRAATPVAMSASRRGPDLLIEAAASAPVAVTVRAPFPVARAIDEAGKALSFEPGSEPNTVRLTLPLRRVVRLEPKRVANSATSGTARLYIQAAPASRFDHREFLRVGQARFDAPFPGTPGIWRLHLDLRANSAQPCRVEVQAGGATVHAEFAGGGRKSLELPAASLDWSDPVVLAVGGVGAESLALTGATAERVRDVNLLPNASFEDVADGAPVGWRAATITHGAQCRITSAPGGTDGKRCIAVECTAATGGDFGVTLRWPGVRPTLYPRRFRLSCRVRTDPGDPKAHAGVQATAADWVFCQTTPRLAAPDKWAESVREFDLPAHADLTHLRLHMTAGKVGAKILVDQVELVELPVPPPANPPQVPLCMVGDSITWWNAGDYWRKYLVERIPRLAFIGTHSAKLGYSHAAEGGNSTRNVLGRLNAIPACPYYHLLIGTNDNNVRDAAEVDARARGTAGRIRKIVLRLLEKPGCKKVFLGSILPCHTDNPLRDTTNAATNILLRDMLKRGDLPGDRVAWIEYEQPIRKLPNWQPLIRLHPTPEGYKPLAKILADALIRDLKIHDPATVPKIAPGAGVRVDNLWEGGADGATRIPLIAGWYTLSFEVVARNGPAPRVVLHSMGKVKQPLRHEIPIPPKPKTDKDGRVQFEFYTEAEGYGYSRSRVGIECRDVRIDKIMIEKKRPGGMASTYGTGAFIDTSTPPCPGEYVVSP